MHRVRNRFHVAFEQAAGVGIGDHHPRHIGAEPRLERREIDAAFGGRRNILDREAGKGGGRGIGPVRAFGDEQHPPVLAARFERRLDAQDPAKLAVRARLGRHGDAVHAGEFDQPHREFVDDRKRALHRFLRLERVNIGEAGHPRDLFVEARVMLHRAAAKREKAEVDRIILARQARIVAHRFGLAEPRQADGIAAHQRAEIGSGRCLVEIDAGGRGRADLEDQRLLEHQCAVAGKGRGVGGTTGAVHFGAPAGGVERGHASTSFSAAAKAAISSSVAVSVTATTSPFASASLSG